MKLQKRLINPEKQEKWGNEIVIELIQPEPCHMCKTSTKKISISFYVPVCSEVCLNKLWDEYHTMVEQNKGG